MAEPMTADAARYYTYWSRLFMVAAVLFAVWGVAVLGLLVAIFRRLK